MCMYRIFFVCAKLWEAELGVYQDFQFVVSNLAFTLTPEQLQGCHLKSLNVTKPISLQHLNSKIFNLTFDWNFM